MATLHRIEALAGTGRYAVTFRRADGAEQNAIVQLSGDDVTAAEASLPDGWTLTGAAFGALADAVRAVERARASGPRPSALTDVDGGWDVMMGNVVLDGSTPTCTAHGPMTAPDGITFSCDECGARAAFTS